MSSGRNITQGDRKYRAIAHTAAIAAALRNAQHQRENSNSKKAGRERKPPRLPQVRLQNHSDSIERLTPCRIGISGRIDPSQVDALRRALRAFTGTDESEDDITIVSIMLS